MPKLFYSLVLFLLNLRRTQEFPVFKFPGTSLLRQATSVNTSFLATLSSWKDNRIFAALEVFFLISPLIPYVIATVIQFLARFLPYQQGALQEFLPQLHKERWHALLLSFTDQPSAGVALWWWACQDSRCSLATCWCQTVPWTTFPTQPCC